MQIEQGMESLEGITEVVINAIDGQIELFPQHEETDQLRWEATWKSDDTGNVEVVREGKRMVLRFDSKDNFVGIMVGRLRIGTSSGNLDRAVVRLPNGIDTVQINSISGDVRSSRYHASRFLRISTTSGEIDTSQLEAPRMQFSSKSGDIVVEEARATDLLQTETLSGDIRAQRVNFRNLQCTSKSGSITLDDRSEDPHEVKLSAVSGDIQAKTRCSRGTIHSVSGDFSLQTDDMLDPNWSIKTVSGDIVIQAHMLNGTIRFTTVSGDASFKGQRPIAGGKNEYVFGTGKEGTIKVNTVSGDLRIHTLEEAKVSTGGVASQKADDEFVERLMEPSEEVRKIVQTCKQGIITRQEAVELLSILEYNENEIHHFLKDIEETEPPREEPEKPSEPTHEE